MPQAWPLLTKLQSTSILICVIVSYIVSPKGEGSSSNYGTGNQDHLLVSSYETKVCENFNFDFWIWSDPAVLHEGMFQNFGR